MFFPKAMSEIELIVPAADLVRVTKVLGGKGVFHQVETGGIGGDKERQRADGWAESATAYASPGTPPSNPHADTRRGDCMLSTRAAATDLVDLDEARIQVDSHRAGGPICGGPNRPDRQIAGNTSGPQAPARRPSSMSISTSRWSKSPGICCRCSEQCPRPTWADCSPAWHASRTCS